MAKRTPQERLQPALLDRLVDEDPDSRQELREHRLITKTRLRQAVLRDLAWLFNATRLEADVDMSKAPYAQRSVINFGLPAFAGRCASSLEVNELERAIRQLPPSRRREVLRFIEFLEFRDDDETAPLWQAVEVHQAYRAAHPDEQPAVYESGEDFLRDRRFVRLNSQQPAMPNDGKCSKDMQQ